MRLIVIYLIYEKIVGKEDRQKRSFFDILTFLPHLLRNLHLLQIMIESRCCYELPSLFGKIVLYLLIQLLNSCVIFSHDNNLFPGQPGEPDFLIPVLTVPL